MSKGDQTKKEIIRKVAVLFNQQGYASTSMQDITRVTGIQRGGIYNHFDSKDQLALESFDYAASLVGRLIRSRLDEAAEAAEQLRTIATTFATLYTVDSPFPFGCPMLNTAVETKRQMPVLRERAQAAMNEARALVEETVRRGVEQGTLSSEIDVEHVSSIFLATLEGALVLTNLYDDPVHLHRAVQHLHAYVDQLAA